MSLATKLLNTSSRVYHQISASCGFHMLMRPITGNDSSSSSTLSVASTPAAAITNLNQLTQATNKFQSFLKPFGALLTQVAGFKVKGRLKRRCKDCYFVVRHERKYVICPTHPRHKQMAMKKRDYKSWILTHATQSKIRDF